jgi:hypothetical protein
MYFKEIPGDGVDWIQLAWGMIHSRAILNTVMNLRVP